MRRVVLMALLALALPMAAFADSISFTDSGTLGTGGNVTAVGSISGGNSYTISVPLTQFTDNGVTTATAGSAPSVVSRMAASALTAYWWTAESITSWPRQERMEAVQL